MKMNFRWVSIGVILILLLGLAGCTSGGTAATAIPSITTSATPSPSAIEAADDVLPTPGGWAYRANIHQAGVNNPWPPIQVVETTLGSGNDILQVAYRSNIETQAGQTRNNIFTTYLPNVTGNDINLNSINVTLTGVNLPAGITVTKDDGDWHDGDPGRRAESVLRINISSHVKIGEYYFEIDVTIKGKDYGPVPCTVKVTG